MSVPSSATSTSFWGVLPPGLRPLKRRAYAIFWTRGMVSHLGIWVQLATVGTLVTADTGQAAAAGLVA